MPVVLELDGQNVLTSGIPHGQVNLTPAVGEWLLEVNVGGPDASLVGERLEEAVPDHILDRIRADLQPSGKRLRERGVHARQLRRQRIRRPRISRAPPAMGLGAAPSIRQDLRGNDGAGAGPQRQAPRQLRE